MNINLPEWIQNKKVAINPQNADIDKCLQYAITTAKNYQNIDHHPERISKLKTFIDNYNWDNICFPAGHKDYSAFEKKNSDIAINILYVPNNTK